MRFRGGRSRCSARWLIFSPTLAPILLSRPTEACGPGGDNPYGNLGNGTMDYVEHPVKITDHVVAVSPHSATLAVKQDGSLWGWGSDSNGQLGQGSTTWSATPIYIMGGVKLPEETEDVPRSDTPPPGLRMW